MMRIKFKCRKKAANNDLVDGVILKETGPFVQDIWHDGFGLLQGLEFQGHHPMHLEQPIIDMLLKTVLDAKLELRGIIVGYYSVALAILPNISYHYLLLQVW
jgi:hypothetical protein